METGSLINRYVIENLISDHGGTAGVYLAHLLGNEKYKIALKVAKTDPNGKTHEDFLLEREASFLQCPDWRHPGIVRVFPSPLDGNKPQYFLRAVDLPDSPYYMVMEYLQGDSLAKKMKIIQTYSLEWKLELFYYILLAVSFIHEKGYAHRDLKPDNIVFREPITPNSIPQPVLIDFALAANGEEMHDVVEKTLTVEYSPPERIAKSMGMSVECNGQKSDVWSLGVILHEILTGDFMIKGNKEQIKTTIIRERLYPKLPDSANYHLLAAFIREMLDPDANKRPSVNIIIKAIDARFLPPRIPFA